MKPFELLAEAAIKGASPKAVIEVGVKELRNPGSVKKAVQEIVRVKVYQRTPSFRMAVVSDDSKEAVKAGRALKKTANVSDVRVIPDRASVTFLVTAKSKGDAVKLVRKQLGLVRIDTTV